MLQALWELCSPSEFSKIMSESNKKRAYKNDELIDEEEVEHY